MKNRLTKSAVAVMSLALLSTIFLAGCDNNSNPPAQPKPGPTLPQPPKEQVELMPESSNEVLRRHIYNSIGREVETEIQYRDGTKGVVKYRDNGTQLSYKLTNKDGSVRIDRQYDVDGKSLVGGFEMREDNTQKIKVETLPGGVIKTTTWWFDGARIFSVETRQPNGSWEAVYYAKNGKLWSKRYGTIAGVTDVDELYEMPSGNLDVKRVRKSATVTEIYRYRSDGTARYMQTVAEKPNSWGGVSSQVESVVEFGADGKTITRKLISRSGSAWDLEQSLTYRSDGTVMRRTYRMNGYVEKEEILDASGNVTSTKTYSIQDRVTDSFDTSMFYSQYRRDPVQNWQQNEDYPYYRQYDY
jgi:hypothetical protein